MVTEGAYFNPLTVTDVKVVVDTKICAINLDELKKTLDLFGWSSDPLLIDYLARVMMLTKTSVDNVWSEWFNVAGIHGKTYKHILLSHNPDHIVK